MKTLHFLAGLPRSGSTVLAAILNQHPAMYVTPTSGLIDLLGGIVQSWETNPKVQAADNDTERLFSLLRATTEGKYEHIVKSIVMDKSRNWANPQIMATMANVLKRPPKIIATVRNVADCAASFVRVAKPQNVEQFLRDEKGLIAHLKSSYVAFEAGYAAHPEYFCIVDYDEMMDKPKDTLDRIMDFLELPRREFNLTAIEGSIVAERDEEVWNVKGLHDIKPTLQRQHSESSQDVLGSLYDQFCQPAFWKGETLSDRPKQPIDLQLEASTRGEFKLGWEIAQQLEREKPDDNRAAYNRGWYVLSQGKLQEGMALLDRGRIENVFGNRVPQTPCPIWDGKSKGSVLLNLEGGLGDQIYQVRFAKDIAARGCKVIVACSGQLAGLFTHLPYISAVVQHEAIFGVIHEYWVPGMSAVVPLGYEYEDIHGEAYLAVPKNKQKRFRIGLRWEGNAAFEAQHNKKFPPELLFNALRGIDAEFISLQRDEGAQHRPSWVQEVPLSHWGETRDAIATCDLVISSCTSVAHLAGAMGVETWIVSPVLPYYLWAIPGPRTPWYNSVRLFRQETFGKWEHPFNSIRGALKLRRAA